MTHDNRIPPGGKAFGAFLALSNAASSARAPAPEAVKTIAEYFEQWVMEDGHRTFDEVLGFVGGRGKARFLERLRDRLRDLFISHLVAVLCATGFKEDEAAEIVSVAVNGSSDPLFKKQLRQLGANAPAEPRTRNGKTLDHLPAKSVKKIFNERDGRGGLYWSRLAGYFGDECEERRLLSMVEVDDSNETMSFLHDLALCRTFPFRMPEQIAQITPLDELPPALAARLRAK